jgi:transcriptional regulator with XRE-family HTH domain
MNDQDSIAYKIRKYRKAKCMSIDELSQLCDIHPSTLKKYENGYRNPKPDQLLKISNALGVSINAFMEFELTTVSDVISLLMRMDEQTNMKWSGQKDDNGIYIPASITISFDDTKLNEALSEYMQYRETKNAQTTDALEKDIALSLEEQKFNLEDTKNRLLLFNEDLQKRNDG